MDPVTTTIAVAAVSLIKPFLEKAGEGFAGKLGEGAWEKAKQMYEAVRKRLDLQKDPSFQKLAERPSDDGAQAAAVRRLDELLKGDHELARTLADLLKESVDRDVRTVFNVNAQNAKVVNAIDKVEGGFHQTVS
jgi:hypothetical protein